MAHGFSIKHSRQLFMHWLITLKGMTRTHEQVATRNNWLRVYLNELGGLASAW